ncbi:MAG: hypothetical protein ACOVMP_11940 [Chthoniobacterales bacterium]
MKTTLLAGSFAIVFLALFNGLAQEEFVAPVPREIPTRPLPVTPDPKPTIEGIVAEVFRDRQPWQLVNPLAPKRFGDGRKTTSWDPENPGKPKGFIVFALDF